MEIQEIITRQREYFNQGKTLDVKCRIDILKRLKSGILNNLDGIYNALYLDLGKSKSEAYFCEVGMVLNEIDYMLRHVKSFARDKRVHTPIAQFHAKSYRKSSPYGVVLIMSPWNYPFMLSIEPLVDALAAGNVACIKPSAYSPNTSSIIEKLCSEVFKAEEVAVIQGGRKENQALLEQKFDYIFFTGSTNVGKEVMSKASVHLTPVTLELGGKSPTIVEASANIALAAKRIVFGKYLNAGQTCVAPDYILVDKKIHNEFLEAVKEEIEKQYGKNALYQDDYGKIVNEKHFDRLTALINQDKVVVGGKSDKNVLKIEPTVLDNVGFNDAIMQEEIFGPIMPIIAYDNLDDIIKKIKELPHPFALYLFTSDKKVIDKVTDSVNFGGSCINDTIIHLATSAMPFGGVGESGMGAYHGKVGFETFSHTKSIVNKKTWIDLPLRYRPYTPLKDKIIKVFMK